MGFRSTFTTQDYPVTWPDWFCEKYNSLIWISPDKKGAIHSVGEAKVYGAWKDLHLDIKNSIDWSYIDSFVLIYLHECGGITRCKIDKDSIKWSEPSGWVKTEGVLHSYCYGCSDI